MPIEITTTLCYTIVSNVFLSWLVVTSVFILMFVLWGTFNYEKITLLRERKIELTGARVKDVINFCSELINLNAPFMALVVALMVTAIRILWNILMIFVALWLGFVLFI